MKKGLLIFSLVFVFLLSLSVVSAVDSVPDSIKSCTQDSDCVLVDNRNGLCSCDCLEAINKDKEGEYNSLEFDACDVILCEPCPPNENAIPQCVNNVCEVSYSSNGYGSDNIDPATDTYAGENIFFGLQLMFYGGILLVVLVIVAVILLIYFLVRKKNAKKSKRK